MNRFAGQKGESGRPPDPLLYDRLKGRRGPPGQVGDKGEIGDQGM